MMSFGLSLALFQTLLLWFLARDGGQVARESVVTGYLVLVLCCQRILKVIIIIVAFALFSPITFFFSLKLMSHILKIM